MLQHIRAIAKWFFFQSSYKAFWVLPVLTPLLGGCLTMKVTGKDIPDNSSATVICASNAPGTVTFTLVGDGTLSNPGPTTITTSPFSASTSYTPARGTGLSRTNKVTCTYAHQGGGTDTGSANIVIRETLPPIIDYIEVEGDRGDDLPIPQKIERLFEVRVKAHDPNPNLMPETATERRSGVQSITLLVSPGLGFYPNIAKDEKQVPGGVQKDYPGIPPGPPTHKVGIFSPPEHTFFVTCSRSGFEWVQAVASDTARNTGSPSTKVIINCTS